MGWILWICALGCFIVGANLLESNNDEKGKMGMLLFGIALLLFLIGSSQ